MRQKELNVLILGYGSREHALAWKIAQSPRVGHIFIAPGNAGTAQIGTNIAISDEDIPALVRFALETQIDLTVVGTNDPLALGVVDAFQAVGLAIFGPTQSAARLESSKAFAKAFMQRHAIPTAKFAIFNDYAKALACVDAAENGRLVVKISGLGKMGMGVTVCNSKDEARRALRQYMLEQQLGESGSTVIIEERLEGPELSIFGLSDGKTVVPLTPVRDHKRIFDGDSGPNTGGMGAYGPPPDCPPALVQHITETILQPTIDGMAAEGNPYVGVLFVGLMHTEAGLKVLEYNGRFGNPEALVLMSLLESDLVELMLACIGGTLGNEAVVLRDGAAAAVMLASPGYPAHTFATGLPIIGTELAAALPDVTLFHHGTAQNGTRLVTSRGRVLAVTAVGESLAAAVDKAYTSARLVQFEGAHYRRDIGRSPRPALPPLQLPRRYQPADVPVPAALLI